MSNKIIRRMCSDYFGVKHVRLLGKGIKVVIDRKQESLVFLTDKGFVKYEDLRKDHMCYLACYLVDEVVEVYYLI